MRGFYISQSSHQTQLFYFVRVWFEEIAVRKDPVMRLIFVKLIRSASFFFVGCLAS